MSVQIAGGPKAAPSNSVAGGPKAAPSNSEDRRDAKAQRIPFEAIVELGGEAEPNAAFEAQGVDLSATGMHLRTAYLPEVGQPLLCRFGSGAQEISAEAEVVWRKEGARGGEFGIRFTNLDGASAAALWEMCGASRGEPSEGASRSSRPEVDAGTRVRLHIDGLGSPMKARVRGATDGELLVGSNLEFLRVGRSLELEDVDRGGKRPAHIDRVDVEIDRVSRVPQLVVTLRYDDVPAETSVQIPLPAALGSTSSEAVSAAYDAADAPPAAHVRADASSDDVEMAKMMRSTLSTAAADIMPKMAELGLRAKTTLGLLVSKAVQRSRTGGDRQAPRRTTAPPPSGALHATGKRVVRNGDDADERDAFTKRPRIGKRGAVLLGGTAGLLTVVTAMALHKSTTPPPGAGQAVSATEPTEAATAAPQLAEIPAGGADALQANVPLFGATTLSTTEPVLPGAPAQLASGAPLGFATGSPGGTPGPMEQVDDGRSQSGSDHRSNPSRTHTKAPSFGHGKISHATFLRMKTDGEITTLHGARTATGFTITVPGRRVEGGSSLAGRDSRIASVKVLNGSKGGEVSFQFKDGVPPYFVRAKGHDVQIALGRAPDGDDDDDQAATTRGATASKRSTETHHRSKRD